MYYDTEYKSRVNHSIATERKFRVNLKEIVDGCIMSDAIAYMDDSPFTPLPLRNASSVEFPIEVFPAEAQRHLRVVATTFGVPMEIVGSMLLGALAVACRGKFRVMRNKSHFELLTLYLLMTLPSGCRKTPLFNTFMAPIEAQELVEKAKFKSESAVINEEKRLRKLNLANERRKLAASINFSGDDPKAAAQLLAELKGAIPAAKFEPSFFFFSRFTPAGIEKAVCRQGGVLAIASDELGSFKQLPENRDEIFLHGYEGGSFTYSKASDVSLEAESVRLAIVLLTQDYISLKLLGKRGLQEDGLLARFLVVTPPDESLGQHNAADAVPDETQQWITQTLQAVLDVPALPAGSFHDLKISAPIEMVGWRRLFSRAESQQGARDLSPVLRGFYGKLAGTALRLAGMLHLLGNGDSIASAISDKEIRGGIRLAEFYEAQAAASLDSTGAQALANAQKILKAAHDARREEFTFREVYRATHLKRDELLEALVLLEKHNLAVWRNVGKSDRIALHRDFDIPQRSNLSLETLASESTSLYLEARENSFDDDEEDPVGDFYRL